jgi:hypothetical protein
MRYSDLARGLEAPQTVDTPQPERRIVVPYDDFDGISLLADHASLVARYADHDLRKAEDIFTASVAANPVATLTALATAGEVLAWGTHQSPGACFAVLSLTPFSQQERDENGMRSSLDVGVIRLSGPLSVAAWHSFTYGCDYRHGEIECPRVDLPLGTYRVTVHRPFGSGEDPKGLDAPMIFLVSFARADESERVPSSAVPGADGWF